MPSVTSRAPTSTRPSRSPLRSAGTSPGRALVGGHIAHVGVTLPIGSDGQAFLWEGVLTFFLMFVIIAVATDTRAVGEAAAIAIGGTVGLDAMFGGPITGASMNPARSLGPAIAASDYAAIWVYLTAPLLGATLAAATYQFLRAEGRPQVNSDAREAA